MAWQFLPRERLGLLLLGSLTGVSLLFIGTELTYDEAVYLTLARRIAESGLPLRRSYEDFSQFVLFANSPPLVLYLAAITQVVLPGSDVAARLLQVLLFAVPTYLLIWTISLRRYGFGAAVASLVALLASGPYLRSTTHVQLDVPLGLLAIVTLFAAERASSRATTYAQFRWSALAACSLTLALWTKYQAVCIVLAILVWSVYLVWTRDRRVLRALAVPGGLMVVGLLVGVGALIAYFTVFDGGAGLAHGLQFNARRVSTGAMSTWDVARDLIGTAREIESRVGGVLLAVGSIAMLVERRHRRWLGILTAYVLVNVAFNLVVFRLPGAGAKYLDSVVPALALLAGPSIMSMSTLVRSPRSGAVLATAGLIVQLAGMPPRVYAPPAFNASRAAARYIEETSQACAGVIAETVAIEFYTGWPVRALAFTGPDVLLRSLENGRPESVEFVVLPGRPLSPRLAPIERQWSELLSRHFETAPVKIPGTIVYRRRDPGAAAPAD